MTPSVRDATEADAAACAAIYAPFVRESAVSFETEPPDVAELARRIAAAQQHHVWLVAEIEDVVVGYTYATAWKSRASYRWTCEVSVYVGPGARRGGVGRALYEALLRRLEERGYRTVVAGVTLPNAASEGLHAALGFTEAGVLRRLGRKHGRWHDVALLQRGLGPDPYADEPPEPT